MLFRNLVTLLAQHLFFFTSNFYIAAPLLEAPEDIDPWIAHKTPVFYDNFSSLDPTHWKQRLSGPRKDCINTPEAVTIENGHLGLYVFSKTDQGKKKHYCAMISTEGLFESTYGYWEAYLRFNYQPGVQTAFWLQSPTNGKDITNPSKSGMEIDVFEHLDNQAATGNNYAVHWNGYQQYARHWSHTDHLSILDDDKFHRFGLFWSPKNYSFYVDGKRVVNTPRQVPISERSQYIILSTELPHAKAETDFGPLGSKPPILEVEKVRVFPLQ